MRSIDSAMQRLADALPAEAKRAELGRPYYIIGIANVAELYSTYEGVERQQAPAADRRFMSLSVLLPRVQPPAFTKLYELQYSRDASYQQSLHSLEPTDEANIDCLDELVCAVTALHDALTNTSPASVPR